MQRDLLLKLLDGLRLPLDPLQLLGPQDGLGLMAEQRLQELARVVEHLVLPGGLSVVQNPDLRLSGERGSDQLVRAIQHGEVLHVLRSSLPKESTCIGLKMHTQDASSGRSQLIAIWLGSNDGG